MFSTRSKAEAFAAVINALSYTYDENLFHCDVKPANVIVGDHREEWLADWGIARGIPGTHSNASAIPYDCGGALLAVSGSARRRSVSTAFKGQGFCRVPC